MTEPETELTFAESRDGWELALTRFRAEPVTRAAPVVLCHGLASTSRSFDLAPELSLARHLARLGFAVYALDLRGRGASRARSPSGVRGRWGFGDYLHHDLPAAIAHVKAREGARRVHWIGHSMGGVLVLSHLAAGGGDDIASAVTVASSLDYSSGTGFSRLRPFLPLLSLLPRVPVRPVARLSARLSARRTSPDGWVPPFERFNVWPTNVEADTFPRLCRAVFVDVSPPVMMELASALDPGGLAPRGGGEPYSRGLSSTTAPVFMLAGSRDPQCPPAAAEATFRALGTPHKELRVFGRDQGEADHYGHFDLLVGRRAPREVWGPISEWLARWDAR